MSFLPTVLMVAATGLSIYSEIQSGKARASAYQTNAEIAQMQARQAKKAGEYEVGGLKREKRRMTGRQRALYAKSGVVVSGGSPLEVMADTATEYQMDIGAQRYNIATQAGQYRYQSEIYKSRAKTAKQMGYMSAGKTLLTGGYGVGKVWPKKKD